MDQAGVRNAAFSQTTQKSFGSLSVEVPASEPNLRLIDSPHSPSSEDNKPAAVRISIQREKPFKIREPSVEWLALFGFSAGHVKDRAFRICHGPQTNVKALCNLIENAESYPLATDLTFYTNSGDEVTLTVSSMVDEKDPTLCVLMMESSSARVPREKLSKVAKVVLSAEAPHGVTRANSKFLQFFHLLEADVLEQGVGAIFCHKTDGTRWRNLLKSALDGGRNECVITTRRGDDSIMATTVAIAPIFDKCGHRIIALEVCFNEAPAPPPTAYDFDSGSCTSTESFHSDAETTTEFRRAPSCAAKTCSGADRSVLSHLKAMKAARKKKESEASKAALSTVDVA
eukprot:CAMPEP_0196730778 /NCGR_PEP_ID=MMETSP1091-20130531/10735_1 /TAXON_ID=302021 /ORGANISM="Rhodomonas sp., Strain CCMP768" /LENGTH=342 /DNA_ID=CAMNT_0042073843 /DNA_START=63 /DNA_END=1091 /DNA_ORIENTATION=+